MTDFDHFFDVVATIDIKFKEEQVSLIFAHWIVQYSGKVNHPEPVVNALAQLANLFQDKASLINLYDLMSQVDEACALETRLDKDGFNPDRPWRLLHFNHAIVATRTQSMDEMDAQEYPAQVRQLIELYQSQPTVSWH